MSTDDFKTHYQISFAAKSLTIRGNGKSYLELGIWTPGGNPKFHVIWVNDLGVEQFNRYIATDTTMN